MEYSMVSEDVLSDLSILREKAAAALDCVVYDDATCAHGQTLGCIAIDYLSEMRETIQAMQKNMVTVPPA